MTKDAHPRLRYFINWLISKNTISVVYVRFATTLQTETFGRPDSSLQGINMINQSYITMWKQIKVCCALDTHGQLCCCCKGYWFFNSCFSIHTHIISTLLGLWDTDNMFICKKCFKNGQGYPVTSSRFCQEKWKSSTITLWDGSGPLSFISETPASSAITPFPYKDLSCVVSDHL